MATGEATGGEQRLGRRRYLLVGIIAAAFFGLWTAKADAAVYCVAASNPESISDTCSEGLGRTSIQTALDDANTATGENRVLIGPGSFVVPSSGLTITSDNDPASTLEIFGSGSGGAGGAGTTITTSTSASNAKIFEILEPGTVIRDMRLEFPLTGVDGSGDSAIFYGGGAPGLTVTNLHITGPGSSPITGINTDSPLSVHSTVIDLAPNSTGSTGIYAGSSLLSGYAVDVSDSVIDGPIGFFASEDEAITATVARTRFSGVSPSGFAVKLGRGNLTVESSLIDLGPTGEYGIYAGATGANSQNITATVLGSTIVGSKATAQAVVTRADSGETVDMTLDSSLIDLSGASSTGLFAWSIDNGSSSIAAGYSNFTAASPKSVCNEVGDDCSAGSGASVTGTSLGLSPGFVGSGDDPYSLSPTSALIDAGNPAGLQLQPPTRDLFGNSRALDSTGDSTGGCTSRRDVGAYEYLPPGPTATIVSPAEGAKTTDTTPTFDFTSSSDCSFAGFDCSIDSGARDLCSSPFTPPALSNGSHTLEVRALGEAGDPGPPVTRTITVDTVAPNTSIKGKTRFKAKGGKATASFTLVSSEPGSTFTCKFRTSGYKPCKAALKLTKLKRGKYTLSVKARDGVGNTDASPAVKKFQVK